MKPRFHFRRICQIKLGKSALGGWQCILWLLPRSIKEKISAAARIYDLLRPETTMRWATKMIIHACLHRSYDSWKLQFFKIFLFFRANSFVIGLTQKLLPIRIRTPFPPDSMPWVVVNFSFVWWRTFKQIDISNAVGLFANWVDSNRGIGKLITRWKNKQNRKIWKGKKRKDWAFSFTNLAKTSKLKFKKEKLMIWPNSSWFTARWSHCYLDFYYDNLYL